LLLEQSLAPHETLNFFSIMYSHYAT
jgi:hypothetical protein